MDTPALHALTVLLRQRERERDQARAAAARAQAQHAAAEAQMAQLNGYRLDYERRWALQFRQPNSVDLLQAYHAFCERLTQAIEQQSRLLAQRTQQRDVATAALGQHEAGVATVERLIATRRQDARRAADRIEQKATDEFASQRRHHAMTAQAATREAANDADVDHAVDHPAEHDQRQEAMP